MVDVGWFWVGGQSKELSENLEASQVTRFQDVSTDGQMTWMIWGYPNVAGWFF
jgi:hypothetical protein